jgi:hypothetical protein
MEHGFLAAMLALVGLEVVVLEYFAYRISRVLERVEGGGRRHLPRSAQSPRSVPLRVRSHDPTASLVAGV